ncbi:MAG: hypothetical protein RI907_192 [Pseudomonadota bacterium]|jgi:hypothetical protein
MTTTAFGPDSAFMPDEALPAVAQGLPATPRDHDAGVEPGEPRPGHASNGNWLSQAMAIWLAPEDDDTPPHSPAH